jgi:hypothetical protein
VDPGTIALIGVEDLLALLVVGWPTATSSFAFAGREWFTLLGIGAA